MKRKVGWTTAWWLTDSVLGGMRLQGQHRCQVLLRDSAPRIPVAHFRVSRPPSDVLANQRSIDADQRSLPSRSGWRAQFIWVGIVCGMWVLGFVFAELIPVSIPHPLSPLATSLITNQPGLLSSSSTNSSPSSPPSSPLGQRTAYPESSGSSCVNLKSENKDGARLTLGAGCPRSSSFARVSP
jgi:hypothetical protein